MASISKGKFLIMALFIIGIAAIIFLIARINSLGGSLAAAEQNNAALRDSIRTTLTLNGELEYQRLLFVAEKDSLQKYSKSLSDELKKERGKVRTLTNMLATIKQDTIEVENTVVVYPNGERGLEWATKKSGEDWNRALEGISKFRFIDTTNIKAGTTLITKDELAMKIVTGIKEREDKKLEIFVRSNYPGISFTNIEGAILDPYDPIFFKDEKRFSIGPVISAGLNQELKLGFHIGIGLQYSLFRF